MSSRSLILLISRTTLKRGKHERRRAARRDRPYRLHDEPQSSYGFSHDHFISEKSPKGYLFTAHLSSMASFSLPRIHDNADGGWGPPATSLPEQFKYKDVPYAPYSKSDKLGRFADWNDISDNRQSTAASSQSTRGGPAGRRRDGTQAFGSGTASAFTYFHAEDESSFSVVDNKATAPRRGGGFSRGGRGAARGASTYSTRGNTRGGRGGTSNMRGGGGGYRGGRRGGRDWDKVSAI